MMDEQLIDEVAHHGVIFNRQKYYLNGSGGGAPGCSAGGQGKYETKDEAWQIIAMKLRTDVETCKKRWKYLRERYVSQRKQGDPPVYEHLSRPYLEKMKFLDQHIQPRKSYRNVPSFLTSPHSANSSNYGEYNMDSSKSNGSMKGSMHYPHYQDQHAMNALSSAAAAASALENGNSIVKTEADQVFRNFAAAVANQQLQQLSQTQSVATHHHQAAAVAAAAAMAASSQNYQEQYRENSGEGTNGAGGAGMSSLSASMKTQLPSPLSSGTHAANNGHVATQHQQQANPQSSSNTLPPHVYNDNHNDDVDSSTSSNFNMKKPRVQIQPPLSSTPMHNNSSDGTHHMNNTPKFENSHFVDDSDEDSDDNSTLLQPLGDQQANNYNAAAAVNTAMQRHVPTTHNTNNASQQQQQQQQSGVFPANADFLFQLYQQLPQQQQQQQPQQVPHQALQQQQHVSKFQMPQTSHQRSSEHLLGELVTTELLKMSKERRKNVQKRILEILFFDD